MPAGKPDPASDTASTLELVSWALYDWASSAFAAVIQTFVFAAYFTRQVAENVTIGTTQWGNALAAAGLGAAVAGPILGAFADQGGRRKPWIIAFTCLCVGATALLWFVEPTPAYTRRALLLVALATLGMELAHVFYNAMLAWLVPPNRLGRWSGWGWGLGYSGGVVCLLVALLVFIRGGATRFGLDPAAAEPVRATFLLVAGWYLVFACPLFLFTRDTRGTGKQLTRAMRDGLEQLRDSARQVRRYTSILRFLIARMLYIDGLATVFSFGGVYAAGTFAMDEETVLTFGIALNVTAGLGAVAFAWVDDWLGSKSTILLSLVGLIGTGTGILLVESRPLFWLFGLLLGVFVGPVQAASRSFLARSAPAPLRNQMFGLYTLSGKATAFLGPLLVGWVTYLTGNQRLGMATVLVFFLGGLLLLLTVPAPKEQLSPSR